MRVTRTATRLLVAALCCALAFVAVNARASKSTQTQTVERVVHVAPFRAGESRYVYVPFDVPRGASRVHVSYEYPREGGANTLDLGVFDARFGGTDADSRGFRGWSGGRRAEFFISRDEATPGYLAGELPAGRWRVVLGLYRVAPSGVDVKIKITVETEEAGRRASKPSRATSHGRVAAGLKPRWFAGDMHMHTVHSDGDWTVRGLVAAARAAGLDFIFVTDHNTASHHAEVEEANDGPRQPLVMRGEEITTYGGHTNAWGLPPGGWVDFRVRPGDDARMREVVARAHRLGALISVNHPFALCGGCDWSYREALKEFDAVEVWNGEWDATDESALKMWDGLLRRGLRPTAVASSDTHREQNPVGRPTTRVAAVGLTQATLLDSIRRGRVYLTAEAGRPLVSFEAWARGGVGDARSLPGDEMRLAAPGTLLFFVGVRDTPPGATASLVTQAGVSRTVPFDSGPNAVPTKIEVECERDGYYRLEVRDKSGAMLALTNPIYVKVGARR
ncbi:MAG TPA: CehA/McbA family metallohydrolase [Pyrinomonadaceae bacterium]